MRLYYWRGSGVIGYLIRKSTVSQWDHVAVGFDLAGVPCYFESLPLVGVRLVPIVLDPPDAVQDMGVDWTPSMLHGVIMDLGKPYGFLNAIMAACGMRPHFHGIECAQLVANVLGLPAPPTPENISKEVEFLTGNKVEVCR